MNWKLLKNQFSRKWLVFITATVALFTGHLDSVLWSGIAATFIGAQAYLDSKTKNNSAE